MLLSVIKLSRIIDLSSSYRLFIRTSIPPAAIKDSVWTILLLILSNILRAAFLISDDFLSCFSKKFICKTLQTLSIKSKDSVI